MARWALGYVALGRGEYDRARDLLTEALAFGDTSEMLEWRLPPMWGLAQTAVLTSDTKAAIERCEAALALCIETAERALLAPFVVTGVRAYLDAGRPGAAEGWLSRCAAHLAATPAFGRAALDHGAGLVALAAGSNGTARTSLEAAVVGWDRHGRLWEGQWARLDLATAHIRANRFAAAVAIAAEVRETAARIGSPSLLSRADDLVRQARGRIAVDEPWRPLTAREFDVARLISEGRTNAEIAEELGIAPKTASSHVEHILAKLGASRRAEIASWAATIDRSAVAR
jgi:DNA-binding CsgD family transcriptional regulator